MLTIHMNDNTKEIDQLAHGLAYEAARSYIQSLCGSLLGHDWRDTTATDDPEAVQRAVRYLELRNLLERHPKKNTVVRTLDVVQI